MAEPPTGGPTALAESEARIWEQALAGILSQPGQTTAEGSAVLPWLLLGGKHAATDASDANTRRVTHVLNVSEPWSADGPNRDSLTYLGIEAYDEPGYPLLAEHYSEAAAFLEQADPEEDTSPSTTPCDDDDNDDDASQTCCLVHCSMGVNRSAAVVVAYLVDIKKTPLLAAVEQVKSARGAVLGNKTFRAELIAFAAARGMLDSTALRDQWAAKAPPPEVVLTVPPPPAAWVEAAAAATTRAPASGTRCRVMNCGWYAAVVTRVEQGYVHVRYDHDGETDMVPVGSPDCVCDPASTLGAGGGP